MKAIEFPEANAIFAKNQDAYLQLSAYRAPDGIVTSCYQLTWKERLQVLFGANFNELPPAKASGFHRVLMSTDFPKFIPHLKERDFFRKSG